MQQTKQPKVFAFKLADKQQNKQQSTQQKQVRQGVTASGCTGPDSRASFVRPFDNSYYC